MLCRAKVNLTLHVGAAIETGRWANYHPVESLVVFADIGDHLTVQPAGGFGQTVGFEGPFGAVLADMTDSSVHRALSLCGPDAVHVRLEKNLPVASGLGGGTADAAGVLRMFDTEGAVDPIVLGADGPVCHYSRTAMMEGIGERITALPGLGQLHAVLANPGVAVSTGAIFQAFDALPRDAAPSRTDRHGSLLARAYSGENDLQNTAIVQAPVIAELLDLLREQDGCDLSRMSGSGASCFGIFRTAEQANEAAGRIARDHDWWAVPCRFGEAD